MKPCWLRLYWLRPHQLRPNKLTLVSEAMLTEATLTEVTSPYATVSVITLAEASNWGHSDRGHCDGGHWLAQLLKWHRLGPVTEVIITKASSDWGLRLIVIEATMTEAIDIWVSNDWTQSLRWLADNIHKHKPAPTNITINLFTIQTKWTVPVNSILASPIGHRHFPSSSQCRHTSTQHASCTKCTHQRIAPTAIHSSNRGNTLTIRLPCQWLLFCTRIPFAAFAFSESANFAKWEEDRRWDPHRWRGPSRAAARPLEWSTQIYFYHNNAHIDGRLWSQPARSVSLYVPT